MQSAELRDLMVKRVQTAHKKHPTLKEWPEIKGGDILIPVGDGEKGYVEALYAVCAEGEPIGRHAGALVGKRIKVES